MVCDGSREGARFNGAPDRARPTGTLSTDHLHGLTVIGGGKTLLRNSHDRGYPLSQVRPGVRGERSQGARGTTITFTDFGRDVPSPQRRPSPRISAFGRSGGGVSYSPRMALYQELTGQGRVVGGHLAGGAVLAGGSTPFSRNGDLSIQHSSNPFRRHKINADTVSEWEELDPPQGVAGAMGQAAARAALPGVVGKAVGAGLGAAFDSGHTVRVIWADGKQSMIGFPEKQFMVLSILLKDRQVTTELSAKPEADVPPPGVAASLRASPPLSCRRAGRNRPSLMMRLFRMQPDRSRNWLRSTPRASSPTPILGQEGRTPQAPIARIVSPASSSRGLSGFGRRRSSWS